MSTHIDLSTLQHSCVRPPAKLEILLNKKDSEFESDSDISEIEYLNRFRRGTKIYDEGKIEEEEEEAEDEEEDEEEEEEELNEINSIEIIESNLRCPTIQEIKDGLHGLKTTKSGTITFTSLEIRNLQLEDISLISEFSNLKYIDISDNLIRDVSKLGSMPFLKKINARNNSMESFLEMNKIPISMECVDFSFNEICSLVNLENFWSLTEIYLSNNQLESINDFSMEFLQILDLSYNKIEVVENFKCPNLLILYLNSNNLDSINLDCNNLRYINLNSNRISQIKGLKYMNQLTEIHLQDNNINDISELEHLQTNLNLEKITMDPNPITLLENWKLVILNMLPQILFMDGDLNINEMRRSINLFSPSFKKMSFEDHSSVLVDRACQSANIIFDDYCRCRPFPKVLLLVGPPRSHCHTLALLLKQRFRGRIHLGGVHSTATTIEGSNPKVDIPVSFECFKEMKNRGEFLATSEIFGRVCGFATSQIARAAEKGSLLVATVPLTTAISLRGFAPKLVLAIPNSPPDFPLNEERTETLKRSLEPEVEDDNIVIKSRKSSDDVDDHLVNFVEKSNEAEIHEPVDIDGPQHSILRTPKFEISHFDGDLLEDRVVGFSVEGSGESESRVRIEADDDGEEKRRNKLKSLAPGMERYTIFYSDVEGRKDSEHRLSLEDINELIPIKENSVGNLGAEKTSKVRIQSLPPLNKILDLEEKRKRLKSLAPGMEKYSIFYPEEDFNGNEMDEEPQAEKKKKLKSLAPGMEKYSNFYAEKYSVFNLEEDESDETEEEQEEEEESSEEEEEEEPPEKEPQPMTHKEAVTISIQETKDKYIKFHQDNPGFFHGVLDTDDLCSSFQSLETMVKEMIKCKDNINTTSISHYAGMNRMDEKLFLEQRMEHFKNCAVDWSGGDRLLGSSGGGGGISLLSPDIPKKKMSLKMKRVLEFNYSGCGGGNKDD